jgi:hypothetical protein
MSIVAAVIILPVVLFSLAEVDFGNKPEQPPKDLLDLMAPLSARPGTGEIINVETGELVDNMLLNGAEPRRRRVSEMSAARDPVAHRQRQKPTFPAKVDLNVIGVDITDPQHHTSVHRGKEKPEERADREMGELAILDPARYAVELDKIRAAKRQN